MSNHSSRTRARRRADVRYAAGAVVALVVLAWVVITIQSMAHDMKAKDADLAALAQQVRDLGGKPVAGPPGSQGKAGQTGQAGVGSAGPTGPAGPSGAAGKDAPTITPSSGPTGATGPMGPPGADSTVPGPTGPAGPAGQDGASGAPGKDGSDGKNGTPPSSWTYTDQDGNEYKCVPVDDFDPDNPRYTCTQTSTATPTPSAQPTPSDSASTPGLLPLLRN